MRCSFLFVCSGYYRYDQAYDATLPGIDRFHGRVVHPQQWPEDLDYLGKRVVVIGSGATAVTLVPAMAREAAHVTMLQRSPSYVLSVPSTDPIARMLRRALHHSGWRTPWFGGRTSCWRCSSSDSAAADPNSIKTLLRKAVVSRLPSGYDVATHFNPAVQPVGSEAVSVAGRGPA